MEKREPPYKRRPTETLFLGARPTTQEPMTKVKNVKEPERRVKRELDEETSRKIWDYIYSKKRTPKNTSEKRPTTTNLTKSGHKQDFYVHSSPQMQQNGLDGMKQFVDSTLDSLNININLNLNKGIEKDTPIDIEFLKKHGITLGILISEIGVKMSDMYAGDVLRSFKDLVEIGFQSIDLVRDRELFNCDMLGNLYNANYQTIRENAISFDVRDIVHGEFLASELHALGYNLEDPIEKGHIVLPILKTLNFSLKGLVLIGFRKEHLKKLKIGKREALDLEWDEYEYQQFLR